MSQPEQTDTPSTDDLFLFGGFRLDRQGGGLFRQKEAGGATAVTIGARALDVLGVLVSRPGELVSKQEIMQAVWPGLVVEEKNLGVQISALRRILDDGRTERSYIQTDAGRGYRFIAPVARKRRDDLPVTDLPAPPPAMDIPSTPPVQRRRRHRLGAALAAASVLVVGALMTVAWTSGWIGTGNQPPRLSIVVMPFQNMDDDPANNYLADAITDDLTSELARLPGAGVIARESAYTYKGKPTDVRQVGRELGVRYVLEGSVRKIGSILRINVQLVSAETGVHMWSDRFDEEITHLAEGQQQIVIRLGDTVGINLVEIEATRGLRERPINPDAFDLILRARSLNHLTPNPQRNREQLALYERALVLDPRSAFAMAKIAYFLTDAEWGTPGNMQRAGQLLEQARAIEPQSAFVLESLVYWLRSMGRCAEVIEAAERAIRIEPNRMRTWTGVYNELAVCKTRAGHAEGELTLQAQADELNPRSPFKFSRSATWASPP